MTKTLIGTFEPHGNEHLSLAEFLDARYNEETLALIRESGLLSSLPLYDLERKRRTVKMHHDAGDGLCYRCHYLVPCDTLRALGCMYADHPDYQMVEWGL
jgi:hypothetical protein